MLAGCHLSAAVDQSAFLPPRVAHFSEVRSAESGELAGGVGKLDGVAAVEPAKPSQEKQRPLKPPDRVRDPVPHVSFQPLLPGQVHTAVALVEGDLQRFVAAADEI